MPNELLHETLHWVATAISVIGAVVIAYGVLLGVLALLKIELGHLKGDPPERHAESLRQRLGFYLLLGLLFLVAADIIETIVEPTLEHLVVLGAIVVIRTVISYTLNWELRQHHATEKTA